MNTFSGKLEKALNNLSLAQYPPDAVRTMRKFSSTEVAALLVVPQAYIRQQYLQGPGQEPETTSNGRRLYAREQVQELRMLLAEKGRKKCITPRRIEGEDCQIIVVTNSKGGSSTTS